MKETKVSVLNESNEKLVGIETAPSIEKERYPTVLLVHGFGATKSEHGLFDGLAMYLAEHGMLTYRFDFSGCGESGGDFSNTSLSKCKLDLSNVLNFVKKQAKVDSSKIGVIGYSFGALAVTALAPGVEGLVFVSTSPYAEPVLAKLFDSGYHPNAVSQRRSSRGFMVRLMPHFWKDLKQYQIPKLMAKITIPTLFIHGSDDGTVPVSEMEAYFKHTNEPKERIIIEGADHGLRPHRDKMYKIVVDWFKKYLV